MKKKYQKIIKNTISDLRKLVALLPAVNSGNIDQEDLNYNLQHAELAVSSFPNATEDDDHLRGLFIHALRGLLYTEAYKTPHGFDIFSKVLEACTILEKECPVFATRFHDTTAVFNFVLCEGNQATITLSL
jgi:hypothetical protein